MALVIRHLERGMIGRIECASEEAKAKYGERGSSRVTRSRRCPEGIPVCPSVRAQRWEGGKEQASNRRRRLYRICAQPSQSPHSQSSVPRAEVQPRLPQPELLLCECMRLVHASIFRFVGGGRSRRRVRPLHLAQQRLPPRPRRPSHTPPPPHRVTRRMLLPSGNGECREGQSVREDVWVRRPD